MTATVFAPDCRRMSSTDRRHTVEASERTLLLGAVLGAANVAHADGRAVPGGDDEIVELLGLGETAHRPQRLFTQVGRDIATGDVSVLLLQRGSDFGDGELVGGEAIGFDPDIDGARQPADDLHFAHAGGSLERYLHDLVCQLGELANRQVAGQRHRQHRRTIVVLLENHRRIDVVRQQSQHCAHPIANVLRRGVDVAFEIERDVDHRLARDRHRSKFADPLHTIDRLFDDVRDLRLHLFH